MSKGKKKRMREQLKEKKRGEQRRTKEEQGQVEEENDRQEHKPSDKGKGKQIDKGKAKYESKGSIDPQPPSANLFDMPKRRRVDSGAPSVPDRVLRAAIEHPDTLEHIKALESSRDKSSVPTFGSRASGPSSITVSFRGLLSYESIESDLELSMALSAPDPFDSQALDKWRTRREAVDWYKRFLRDTLKSKSFDMDEHNLALSKANVPKGVTCIIISLLTSQGGQSQAPKPPPSPAGPAFLSSPKSAGPSRVASRPLNPKRLNSISRHRPTKEGELIANLLFQLTKLDDSTSAGPAPKFSPVPAGSASTLSSASCRPSEVDSPLKYTSPQKRANLEGSIKAFRSRLNLGEEYGKSKLDNSNRTIGSATLSRPASKSSSSPAGPSRVTPCAEAAHAGPGQAGPSSAAPVKNKKHRGGRHRHKPRQSITAAEIGTGDMVEGSPKSDAYLLSFAEMFPSEVEDLVKNVGTGDVNDESPQSTADYKGFDLAKISSFTPTEVKDFLETLHGQPESSGEHNINKSDGSNLSLPVDAWPTSKSSPTPAVPICTSSPAPAGPSNPQQPTPRFLRLTEDGTKPSRVYSELKALTVALRIGFDDFQELVSMPASPSMVTPQYPDPRFLKLTEEIIKPQERVLMDALAPLARLALANMDACDTPSEVIFTEPAHDSPTEAISPDMVETTSAQEMAGKMKRWVV